jgi:hypothetical protein
MPSKSPEQQRADGENLMSDPKFSRKLDKVLGETAGRGLPSERSSRRAPGAGLGRTQEAGSTSADRPSKRVIHEGANQYRSRNARASFDNARTQFSYVDKYAERIFDEIDTGNFQDAKTLADGMRMLTQLTNQAARDIERLARMLGTRYRPSSDLPAGTGPGSDDRV